MCAYKQTGEDIKRSSADVFQCRRPNHKIRNCNDNICEAAAHVVRNGGAANTKTTLHPMEVLALTIFLSVLLAAFFVVLFLGSRQKRGLGSEQEALMPLEDDLPPRRSEAPDRVPVGRRTS